MGSSQPRPEVLDPFRAAARDPARLAEANINPATGLANDYLNHFNEAIMALEMVATAPECVEHLLDWRPVTYREHFEASRLRHRELAISAYEVAEHAARSKLNRLTTAMHGGLVAIREALRANPSPPEIAAMAEQAAVELRRLVARASAVINGTDMTEETAAESNAQAAVDALMDR
jgi:hypothetical protein